MSAQRVKKLVIEIEQVRLAALVESATKALETLLLRRNGQPSVAVQACTSPPQ
jgi:hypothetical protein